MLWNVVGGSSDELTVEVYRAELALGDTLLLCTDGLTKQVADAQIARLLSEDEPSAATCRRLVEAANRAGGADNVTVVVAHFREASRQQAVQEAEEAAEEPAPAAPAPAGARPEDVPAPAEAVPIHWRAEKS